MRRTWLLLSVLLAACGGGNANGGADAPRGVEPVSCDPGVSREVALETDDGVRLIADFDTPAAIGDTAVILLHMIPPNTKANYPKSFRDELTKRGHVVISVNRRGAPGSDGVAEEAYTGPKGKLDAKAGYDTLFGACSGLKRYAVVGASNGTTTALDFTLFAAGDAGVRAPTALVFLSGGPYTESQNKIADNLEALASIPNFLAYPPGEAEWNDGIAALKPAGWTFHEYQPGAHGTHLFESNPEVPGEVADFLDARLKP